MAVHKIALFASGSGTNVENIARYFQHHHEIAVSLVLSNNPEAFVLKRAENLKIPSSVFTRNQFYESHEVIQQLIDFEIDWIILAGFLWLIPDNLIEAFPGKIVNIHPALLPKYGGKGMYGDKVHQAVVDNHEKESGVTIHLVNSRYDEGEILFQALCRIEPLDKAEMVAQKVHALEYEYYPKIIEKLVLAMPIEDQTPEK